MRPLKWVIERIRSMFNIDRRHAQCLPTESSAIKAEVDIKERYEIDEFNLLGKPISRVLTFDEVLNFKSETASDTPEAPIIELFSPTRAKEENTVWDVSKPGDDVTASSFSFITISTRYTIF